MATTSVALGGSLGPLQVPLAMVFGQPLECPQKWHGEFYRQKVIWVCQKKPLESSGYLFFASGKCRFYLGSFPFFEKDVIILVLTLCVFWSCGCKAILNSAFRLLFNAWLRADPTQCEIDCYHTLLLDAFKETFDKHKAAYGWSQKTLMIV